MEDGDGILTSILTDSPLLQRMLLWNVDLPGKVSFVEAFDI